MDKSKTSNKVNTKILAGVLIAALGLLVFSAFIFFDLGGKIKHMNYTKISSAEDLYKLKDDPDGKFLLTKDIDMQDKKWTPVTFTGWRSSSKITAKENRSSSQK